MKKIINRKKCFIWVMVMLITLGIYGNVHGVAAAQPKIMVSDYKISENEVEAGGTFTLSITIKNTADKKVSNLKISVVSETGEIIPASGAGTDYLSELAGGEEYTFSFKLKALQNIEDKTYKINVTNEYDDRLGEAWTVTDSIYVPVKLQQNASVTDIYYEEEVTLGDSAEITGRINNTGIGTLYNVTAKLQSDYLTDTDTYIGNIEPGNSGYIDILSKSTSTTPGSQEASSDLIVTYEDKEGNVTTMTESMKVQVASPVYDNVEKIKDDTKTVNTKLIGGIVTAVIIVILIIVVMVMKHRRKKKILEEF
jgi:hypothetical protein